MYKSNQFTKALNKLDSKLAQMKSRSAEVRMYYEVGQLENAFDKAIELEELSEQAVLLTRALPAYTGTPLAKSAVEECIKSTVPICIGYTEEGWFSVRMPLLLPKKEEGSADYIRAILYPVIRDFFIAREPKTYENCVLIYRHVYDVRRPERRKRDHDNIEINMVSDIVAMYVMPDDGPDCCSHFYCSAEGNAERTEVYVVPEQEFNAWLAAEPDMPDKGVALYETVPETVGKEV